MTDFGDRRPLFDNYPPPEEPKEDPHAWVRRLAEPELFNARRDAEQELEYWEDKLLLEGPIHENRVTEADAALKICETEWERRCTVYSDAADLDHVNAQWRARRENPA